MFFCRFATWAFLSLALCLYAQEPRAAPSDTKATANISELVSLLEEAQQVVQEYQIPAPRPDRYHEILTTYLQACHPSIEVLSPEDMDLRIQSRNGQRFDLGLSFSASGSIFYIEHDLASDASAIPQGARLLRAGHQSLEGLSYDALRNTLEVQEGQSIDLTYLEPGGQTKHVARAAKFVSLPLIALKETLPENLGYLRLNGLYTDSGPALVSLLRAWLEADIYGIILDLRNASGNDLESVQTLASLFAIDHEILWRFHEIQTGDALEYIAAPGGPISPPLLILVDQRTSGAAELLATVLADIHPRSILLGEPTEGDPLTRKLVRLSDGTTLILAYRDLETGAGIQSGYQALTPRISGTLRGETAYEPDWTQIDELLDEEIEDLLLRNRVRFDPLLERAVDLLLSLKAIDADQIHEP